ncbi:hypothetical protein D3C76_1484540 [compost metagenome]
MATLSILILLIFTPLSILTFLLGVTILLTATTLLLSTDASIFQLPSVFKALSVDISILNLSVNFVSTTLALYTPFNILLVSRYASSL